MTRPDGRRVAAAVGLFVAVVVVGAGPWPGLAAASARGICALADLAVAPIRFGHGGHARVTPGRPATASPGLPEDPAADSALLLRVDGYAGELALGWNARRDGYLPLVLVVATSLAAPLPWSRRGRCLAIGVPLVAVASFASLLLLTTWLFAFHLRGIYSLGGLAGNALAWAFSALWLPPGNRFFGPVLLGVGLAWWQASRPP
jgi:hypothetical protein